jgi:lysophospholipase L1-like esterase
VLFSSVRRAVVLTAAAATVLGTVSCGSSSSDAGSATASPATASPATSSSASSSSDADGVYLALGDSVPFGYRGGEESTEYQEAANFTGYPATVGDELGLDVLNASCPGETTASFLDVTAQSNGCENTPTAPAGFRTTYPLHVAYASAQQSQLDYAVQTLEARDDVKLVTLQIGANDGFICQASTPDRCATEVGAVAATVGTNVATILDALRNDAGYDGTIVVVTYYSLDYADPTTTNGIEAINAALTDAATAAGAEVADAFDEFQPEAEAAGGDPVAAGLVLRNDVHPTEEGQRLLTDAVMSAVNG